MRNGRMIHRGQGRGLFFRCGRAEDHPAWYFAVLFLPLDSVSVKCLGLCKRNRAVGRCSFPLLSGRSSSCASFACRDFCARVCSCALSFSHRPHGSGYCHDITWQVSVHEKSRYARRMFELMRMEIEEQARRFRQQSDSSSLANFLTFT